MTPRTRVFPGVAILGAGVLIATWFLALEARTGSAQTSPPSAPVTGVGVEVRAVDPEPAARLTAALDRSVAQSGAPGVQTAVILADGSTWTAGAGVSAPGQPMTPDLLVPIASVTKLYTAALVLDLASEGLLPLDDPLEGWIPDVPHATGVTIRDLLQHTSGIASDDPALDPVCDPGTCFSYSNAGYRYLGQVIEQATGEPFAAVLRQRILAPLGTSSTFYPRQEEVVGDQATGFTADGQMLAVDAAAAVDGPGWYGASGGLVATAADTARFAHALLTGAVLPPAALATLLDFEAASGLPGSDECTASGMNVWRRDSDLGESWSVGGNVGSFRSWVEHYPLRGVTIAAITNSDVPVTGIVDALAREVVDAAPPDTRGRCNTDIAVRTADGTVRLVTTDPGFDGFPAWSPDGSRLVWSGIRDGRQDLFVARADGSDVSRLTDDAARDLFPHWSPDGASIAFTSDRDGDLEIYLIAPDGIDLRRLTHSDGEALLSVYAPDGSQVAYVSGGDVPHVRVMDADGRNDRELVADAGPGWWPKWSPDGRSIAYESGGVVFIVPVEGGDPVPLPLPQIRVTQHPAWAPGVDIAFSADGDIYATDESGTNLRRLTATSTREEAPAWSPDGSSIAFQISRWDTSGVPEPSEGRDLADE